MRQHALTLPDGRTLAWSAWGAAHGTPVLFVPGAGTGRRMTFGADAAARAGIRGWSVDRPGLGGSTADPRRTLRSTADDLARLLDAHDLDRVAVVASSQGAPFALHLAALGRASSLDLVSPIDELAHRAVEALLDDGRRAFVQRIRERPDEVEAELAGFTADDLLAYVVGSSAPVDRREYEREPLRTMLRDAVGDAFAPGAAGYARDTVLATSPWDVDLDAVAAATTTRIWFGRLDVAHSPDLGATLARRIAGSERRLVDGAGGALLWTHADAILAEIAGARVADAHGAGATGEPALAIRPARVDEHDALVDVWEAAVRATHDFLAEDDVQRYRRLLPGSYLPQVDVRVAERDGRVLGFVGTSGHRIEMLFVDPAAHGSGVGTALLRTAMAQHDEVEVDVNEQNPAAVGFYESRGMRVVGRSATDGEGRPFPLLHLRWRRDDAE